MQASKIIPGWAYAVKRADDNLARFQVHEVNTITKRRGANRSPHDSHSEVVGFFVDDEERKKITLSPDCILGPFQDYQALVEEKARKDAERKAAEVARKKQALADRLTLYEFVGERPPVKPEQYDQLFRAAYNYVDVSEAGVKALAERIRSVKDGVTFLERSVT